MARWNITALTLGAEIETTTRFNTIISVLLSTEVSVCTSITEILVSLTWTAECTTLLLAGCSRQILWYKTRNTPNPTTVIPTASTTRWDLPTQADMWWEEEMMFLIRSILSGWNLPTQKNGIFVHRTNINGFAGSNVSAGCPLILGKQWHQFEKQIGQNGFKMIIRREIYTEPKCIMKWKIFL